MQKEEFGLSLRRLREQAGLSQRELAGKIGVDFSYLSKIENGVIPPPSREVILKLAEVLKADRDELLLLAGKVPTDIAEMLKNRGVLQSLREGTVRKTGDINKGDSFNKRLRELREEAGLSQGELAAKVGVSFTYLSKIENGVKPPPSEKVILKLAEALNCDKDDLMASAGKVPSDIARILKNRELRQSLRQDHAKKAVMSGAGSRKGANIMKHLVKGRRLARIALAFVLVLAIAASLWFSSPPLVKALKIELTNPTGASLDPGTIGQTYHFKLKITIEDGELLPLQNIDLTIFNTANSSFAAYLLNLPLVDGGSANYTNAQTGGGTANVTVTTSSLSRLFGYGYVIWKGYAYVFPTGYGYGAPTGPAIITYTIAWTPPSGWPVGNYKMAAVITANGTNFTQLSSPFTLQPGILAETSLTQGLSSNVSGVIAIKTNINRIKNPTDNTTATISGGIGNYTANVSAAPGSTIQFLALYGVPPFNNPTFDNVTGIFTVPVVSSPIQPSNSTVAELVAILTGNATTSVTLTVAFQTIGAAGQPGINVPEESAKTITLRRGDVKEDATVDIFDALFALQNVVGQRTLAQINALNAASVKHDGAGGDKIDIVDALFILQYVVGQRNASFQ